MIQVESDVVVPVEMASNKEEYAAYTLRKKISPQIEDYLIPFTLPSLVNKIKDKDLKIKSVKVENIEEFINTLNIDQSIKKTEQRN